MSNNGRTPFLKHIFTSESESTESRKRKLTSKGCFPLKADFKVGRSRHDNENSLLFNAKNFFTDENRKILSRSHAVFKSIEGAWTLTDLGSINGTFINDSKIRKNSPLILKHGDMIRFGPLFIDDKYNELVFQFVNSHSFASKKKRVSSLLKLIEDELSSCSDKERERLAPLQQSAMANTLVLDGSSLPKSGLEPEYIKKELSCSICCELFLFSHTLTCGHSFCKNCIDKWLRNSLSCPLCREIIVDVPIPSKTLDEVVELVVKQSVNILAAKEKNGHVGSVISEASNNIILNAPSLSLNKKISNISGYSSSKSGFTDSTEGSVVLHKSYRKRKSDFERELKRTNSLRDQLVTLLGRASTMGYSLVDVSKPWSDREQTRFLQGLKSYTGPSRWAYCDSVSLNLNFIGKATIADLSTICQNLRIVPISGRYVVDKEVDVNYTEWIEKDTANCRARLKIFMSYR